MSFDNWVIVYSTSESHKIQLIKGMLEENEIVSIVMNYGDSTRLLPEKCELYVNNHDAIKAKYLIEKINNDEYEV